MDYTRFQMALSLGSPYQTLVRKAVDVLSEEQTERDRQMGYIIPPSDG